MTAAARGKPLTVRALQAIRPEPLVYVEWVDSIGAQGWHSPDSDLLPALIQSVGWLTAESPEHITLTGHIQTGQIHHHSDLAIPRCAIRSIRPLR